MGENYGHVIQEALSAGCPCLLSDQTPWQDLENYDVGSVFAIDDLNNFANEIESYVKLNNYNYAEKSTNAIQYAIKNSNKKVMCTGYRRIFEMKGII